MSKKSKLKPILMHLFPNELYIVAQHETFRTLREIFDDYKLVLSHSEIDRREYLIKRDGAKVGKLVSCHSGFFENPHIEIWVGVQYQDEFLKSTGIESIKRKCLLCGSEKEPIAKRASVSHGRRPYSAVFSFNCPDCGNEIFPKRRLKMSK